MAKKVIDVSEHQGLIDWEKIKPNIYGAIIRCGYGDDIKSQDDKYWKRNVSECERLNIPYGVYLYSYANTMSHAKSEVKHALRLLKGHKPQLPVYFDTENGGCESMSYKASEYFCSEIEKAGYIAGIYTYESWYNSYLKGLTKYTLWIAKYGINDGKAHEKPNIGVNYDAWQYTSLGKIGGFRDRLDVSYFYKTWTKDTVTKAEQIDVANVAATIHADMCNDAANGYSQSPRWGEDGKGIKKLTIDGRVYQYDRGSFDCSSSVVTACNEALRYTAYRDALKAATYTGNMLSVFVNSGLFKKWNTSKTVAKRGDVYLNYANHTAMCQSDVPDMLSEFSINERGGITGGKVGDQTGTEAYIHAYYDYPWNCTLHWKGKLDAVGTKKTVTQVAKEVIEGMWGNGEERKAKLEKAGYDYAKVQAKVNELVR